jgi:hypothetical protein
MRLEDDSDIDLNDSEEKLSDSEDCNDSLHASSAGKHDESSPSDPRDLPAARS